MREYRIISFNNEPVDLIIDYSDRDLGTMISFPMGDKWVNVTPHCEAGWFTDDELISIQWIIEEKLQNESHQG